MSDTLLGISLGDLSRAVAGTLVGTDCEINRASTDSRSVAVGDVYFCLSGDNFDGHDFARASVAAGAVAIVCERALDCGVAEVIVPDTRKAYGTLAKLWRDMLPVQLIGVTGSNGKTTVKQLLKEIFATAGSVHYTRANDNNDIGVPQTLLGIDESHQFAVVEMGANQLGEIEWLASIAQPNVSIITNVSSSHLEGFGSLDAVYREKSAIYTNLAKDGVAVVNRDDRFTEDWLSLNQERSVITFGCRNDADVYAKYIDEGRVRLHCGLSGSEATADADCQLSGNHNLLNIAAAAAAAIVCGLDLTAIAQGVANAEPVKGRLNVHHLADGITVIDDTYNANPASARAAIDVLVSNEAEHWLVLGDLKELGEDATLHHLELGKFAREKCVDRLFATGSLCASAVAAFGERAEWFVDKQQLLAGLQTHLDNKVAGNARRDTVVLVKGSRSMAMNEVVDALQNRYSVEDVRAAGAVVS